jgi:AcrR family transcriptional regulator
MLVFVRALPGREARAKPGAPPARVTRSTASAEQRRRILRATGELVAKRGYADVSVELIVKRAHVSYKTFYKHFSNKEDCYAALFDRVVESAESAIRQALEEEPRPWAEQVVTVLRKLTELIVADPLIAKAVIVEAPAAGEGISDRYEATIKTLVPLFRAGREQNPRGAELPATVEDTLAGAVFWSAYQRLIVGEADALPEVLPELIQLVLRTYVGEAEAVRIAQDEMARIASVA